VQGVVTHKKNKLQEEINDNNMILSKIDSDIEKTKENMKDDYFGNTFASQYYAKNNEVIDEFNGKVANSDKTEEIVTNKYGKKEKVITYTDKKDGTVRKMVIGLNDDGSNKYVRLYENNKTFNELYGNSKTGEYEIREENNSSGHYLTVNATPGEGGTYNPVPNGYVRVYDPVKQKEQIVHPGLLPDGVTIEDKGKEDKILKLLILRPHMIRMVMLI